MNFIQGGYVLVVVTKINLITLFASTNLQNDRQDVLQGREIEQKKQDAKIENRKMKTNP